MAVSGYERASIGNRSFSYLFMLFQTITYGNIGDPIKDDACNGLTTISPGPFVMTSMHCRMQGSVQLDL